jgi:hypothetical protein
MVLLDHISDKLNTLKQMYEGVPISGYDTPPIPAELEQHLTGPSDGSGYGIYPKRIGNYRIVGRVDMSRDGNVIQGSIAGGGKGKGPAADEKGHVTVGQDSGGKGKGPAAGERDMLTVTCLG